MLLVIDWRDNTDHPCVLGVFLLCFLSASKDGRCKKNVITSRAGFWQNILFHNANGSLLVASGTVIPRRNSRIPHSCEPATHLMQWAIYLAIKRCVVLPSTKELSGDFSDAKKFLNWSSPTDWNRHNWKMAFEEVDEDVFQKILAKFKLPLTP